MNVFRSIRILWIIRVFAGIGVLVAVALTATLTYHIRVKSVGGKLHQLFPEPYSTNKHADVITYAQSLEQRELPDIEPGEQAFRNAMEMMAMGRMPEAHEKLTTIFSIFPNSSVAKSARRIVGDMNMDELLGSRNGFGRRIYKVKAGDSYLAIAARHETTIDMMVHLNSMQQLKGIQPGHELVIMPLNLRLVIDTRRQVITIWDGGRFLKEYPALSMKGIPNRSTKTSIKGVIGEHNGGVVPSHHEAYSSASKIIHLGSGNLQIRAWSSRLHVASGELSDETPTETKHDEAEIPRGILLKPHDMEELALITRKGNVVEFL